jgi:hypothetical protein
MKVKEVLAGRYEILTAKGENRYFVVLFLLVTGMSWYYDYPALLLLRPQSVHNWRQCDGASLALNYYQEGMDFFKPQTHGLYSDDQTTGYTSPSEVPILYYMAAGLYKIFGYHEYLFRLLDLLLFYLGLFYLFKLTLKVLGEAFFSYAVVVLLFSSPIIVYYANNFMPNTGALSFSIIGWYYFYCYSQGKKTGTFALSMLFFGLAGAMKITELSAPIIIILMMLADRFGIVDFQLNAKKGFLFKTGMLVTIFVMVASWVFYAKAYNNLHASSQFSTFIFPIWHLDHAKIAFIVHKMHVIWFREYFYPPTFYFILALIPFTIIFYKRSNRILLIASAAQLTGLLLYSLLWFEALGDHDYFFISFYILPVFLCINFFFILRNFGLRLGFRMVVQAVVILILILSVSHAKSRTGSRYTSWMNDYREMQDVYTAKPYLTRIGIHDRDTAIFYPSMNIRPLYLMNLKGWTFRQYEAVKPGQNENDSISMHEYIARGARYFITNDMHSLADRKSLLPYTKELLGKHGNVYIFSLISQKSGIHDSIP